MTRLGMALGAFVLGATLLSVDADAARLGGGRSAGAQRSIVTPRQAPAQPQRSAPAAAQNQAAAPAQTPPAGNRWLGPLAGLAAGLGLGWLLGHSGLSGLLGGILMAGLIAVAVMFLLRLLARPKARQETPMQYAGIGSETVAAPPPSQVPSSEWGAVQTERAQERPQVPAGFDTEGFLKQAKLNFLRLQAANDRRDAEAMREVTTDEMFDTLRRDIAARGAMQQHTDVTALNASLLEVVTEGDAYWASVRFYGSMREEDCQAPAAFEEVWHLSKPVTSGSGWLLAGIQQVS